MINDILGCEYGAREIESQPLDVADDVTRDHCGLDFVR
jgi:hypothetical protein